MDDKDEFSCVLCKETDSPQNLQKVKTGIKTLISKCEYLENYEEQNRLLEAENQLEAISAYVHHGCRKQFINDVQKQPPEVFYKKGCS